MTEASTLNNVSASHGQGKSAQSAATAVSLFVSVFRLLPDVDSLLSVGQFSSLFNGILTELRTLKIGEYASLVVASFTFILLCHLHINFVLRVSRQHSDLFICLYYFLPRPSV